MAIQRLPVQLANQIAAGEVVERPSSVVKELIENSLDAGAKSIEIDIEKGGHKRIKITDNGCGIDKSELTLALAPHSTSKIASLDDLENIASLGFRGEALASISSVSRLTLTSKPASQSEAWAASTQGREMDVSIVPAAHPNGTSIEVHDLFYNTPARRKFLRAEKTEFQHIEDVIKRIGLSRPQVSFLLKHNNKVVKRWAVGKSDTSIHRIAQVCGKQFTEQAKPISLNYEGVALSAWVGSANLMRSASDMQFCFVNGRAMRDKLLLHAIRQAYETVYELVEQPAYVLFIDLNPNDVDVNVHPAKHEVRFQHARQVHDLVCKAFQDALCEDSIQDTGSPSHDYIQPLQFRSEKTADSASVHTPAPKHQYTANTYAGNAYAGKHSGNASQSYQYQTLMSSSQSGFQQIAQRGLLKVDSEKLHWLSAKHCMQAWLSDKIANNTLAQPLLMPVSVHSEQGLSEKHLQEFSRLHFDISVVGSKAILKQVPAPFRTLPWGRIYPLICTNIPAADKNFPVRLVELICSDMTVLSEQLILSFTWFNALSEQEQMHILQEDAIDKTVSDFVAWIEQ